ncbi:MAG: type II toxin-antitoxin system RelE/ParE family toxin [Rhodospirillales bacterium]|nr:type II toxin-antitoxin system RelE/ParE family toxin [Rhodospirillales bacterium]
MGDYRLTVAAENDIRAIARDSLQRWGIPRAEAYVLGLHETFGRLAAFPGLGRSADDLRPGYFRLESGRHVVFFVKQTSGVLIVRVLHERMDFARHL